MNVVPAVYSKSKVSCEDNQYFYDKYSHLVQWRKDGQDTILDIGSGPGDNTVGMLMPKIPNGFKYLVGADIAQDMVDYANSTHSSSKIFFEQWNMAGEYEALLKKYPDGFDHIFSVYTLHWHPDQQRIIENIYNLLSPNGDCLLAILGRHDIFDIYLEISKKPKWSQLMKNKSHITIPFQYKENRKEICNKYFLSAGFKTCNIEILPRVHVFENIAAIKHFTNAINPFMKQLSDEQKNEYFHDYVEAVLELGLGERIENGNDCKFVCNYEFLIVNARK